MAESWDASVLSQVERATQAHPAVYAMRGEGPQIRISEIRDPATEQLIALKMVGFSTGTFHEGERTVTTTHMKMGVLQKVGVYASPYAVMTEHYFRHGLYLTMVQVVDDPIYLEEPFVRSQTWVLDTNLNVGPNSVVSCQKHLEVPRGLLTTDNRQLTTDQARAFPYNASRRPQAFSACGSL